MAEPGEELGELRRRSCEELGGVRMKIQEERGGARRKIKGSSVEEPRGGSRARFITLEALKASVRQELSAARPAALAARGARFGDSPAKRRKISAATQKVLDEAKARNAQKVAHLALSGVVSATRPAVCVRLRVIIIGGNGSCG